MIDATLIEAINAGGNLGILLVGLAVLDVRGKLADHRKRIEMLEYKSNGN